MLRGAVLVSVLATIAAMPDGAPNCTLVPRHAGLSSFGWVSPTWSFTNFRGDPVDCYIPSVPILVKLEQNGFHGFVVKGPVNSKFEDLPGPIFPRYKVVDHDYCVTHTEPELRQKLVMKWTALKYMGDVSFHATSFTSKEETAPSRWGDYGQSQTKLKECKEETIPWAPYDIWHCPEFVERLNFSHVYECDMHAMCPKDMRCCKGVKGGQIYGENKLRGSASGLKCANFADAETGCREWVTAKPDACRDLNGYMAKNCRHSCCFEWLPPTTTPPTQPPPTTTPSWIPKVRNSSCLAYWDTERDEEKCAKWVARKPDNCADFWSWEAQNCRRMCCEWDVIAPTTLPPPLWVNTTAAPFTTRVWPAPRTGCWWFRNNNTAECNKWVNTNASRCDVEGSFEATQCEKACCEYGPHLLTTTVPTTYKPHYGCEYLHNDRDVLWYKCRDNVLANPSVCKDEWSWERQACARACCEYSWWFDTTTSEPTTVAATTPSAITQTQAAPRSPWTKASSRSPWTLPPPAWVPLYEDGDRRKPQKPTVELSVDAPRCSHLADSASECTHFVGRNSKPCEDRLSWEWAACKASCCRAGRLSLGRPLVQLKAEYPAWTATTGRPAVFCSDDDDACPAWAAAGFCASDDYTQRNCRASCKRCRLSRGSRTLDEAAPTHKEEHKCGDLDPSCVDWAASGFCLLDAFTRGNCRRSCELCDDPAAWRKKPASSLSDGEDSSSIRLVPIKFLLKRANGPTPTTPEATTLVDEPTTPLPVEPTTEQSAPTTESQEPTSALVDCEAEQDVNCASWGSFCAVHAHVRRKCPVACGLC